MKEMLTAEFILYITSLGFASSVVS